MSVTLSSTTDSPEEVQRALESAGQTVESIVTETNEPEKPATEPKKEETPAPAEKPAPEKEAGKPGEGKTADVTETPEETEETEEQVKKKGGGAEKKIDRLTREKAELAEAKAKIEGRLEELARQNEELRELLPKPGDQVKKPVSEETKPDDTTVQEKPKPLLADFETHEEWLDALADWKIETRLAKDNQEVKKLTEKLTKLETEIADKDQKSTAKSEQQDRIAAFQERNAEAVKSYGADWDTVMKSPAAASVQISPLVQDFIWDHDGGADVLKYLIDHPEEAEAVLKLTTVAKDATSREQTRAVQLAGIEYARIRSTAQADHAAKVAAQAREDAGDAPLPEKTAPVTTPKPTTPVSKAPAPIKPTGGAAAAAPSADTPFEKKMTHKEYVEWHRREFPNKYPSAVGR